MKSTKGQMNEEANVIVGSSLQISQDVSVFVLVNLGFRRKHIRWTCPVSTTRSGWDLAKEP